MKIFTICNCVRINSNCIIIKNLKPPENWLSKFCDITNMDYCVANMTSESQVKRNKDM